MCILIAEQLEQLSTLLSEILCPESLSLTYASTQATLGLDFLALRAKDVTQGDVHLCAPVDAKLIDTWAHRSSISPGGYRSSMAAPDCLQTGVRTPGHTRAHLAHLVLTILSNGIILGVSPWLYYYRVHSVIPWHGTKLKGSPHG